MTNLLDRLKAALTQYQLEREVGRGGMATVYLARDLKHHRNVAVKVLRPELASAIGPDRFHREILTVASLTHPHILPLHDSGESAGFLYYVMPFVEGESLRQRLEREQQLPLDDALRIAGEVADALDYAHAHGIVHRDIKPENILFEAGHAVVADFGIARVMASTEVDSFTGPGAAVGTVAYMSPEQAAGSKVLDGRSDQYSLGCVLYEMLAGDPPFSASSAQALIARKLSDSLPRISIVRPTVPPHIEAAINRAMERVAADRFRSMGELAEALRRPPPPPTLEDAPVERLKRRQSVRIAVGALLVLGLFFFAWKGISRAFQAATRTKYPEVPTWSAWRGWIGEYFPVFAVSDSLLMTSALGGTAVHLFNGQRWSTVAIPDSFQLLPYVGARPDSRLLAAKRIQGASGERMIEYWWLKVSPSAVQPLNIIATPIPDEELLRPNWWSDGKDLVLWYDAITRIENSGWVREATGTSGGFSALWGLDVAHRFAITGSSDTLLSVDGINWRVEVPVSEPGMTPSFSNGVTFQDSATVVVGEECAESRQCHPLMMVQDGYGHSWQRVRLPRRLGIPGANAAPIGTCDPARFNLIGAAGRDRREYYVWGLWTTCEAGPSGREARGCPPRFPCFWRVRNANLEVVTEFLGRIVMAVSYMKATPYVLLDDGTLWRRAGDRWQTVTQVPDLPVRRVAASDRVIVRFAGGDLRYEPGQAERNATYVIQMLRGSPPTLDQRTLKQLIVRDSSIALLDADGSVLVSRCGVQRRPSLETGAPMQVLLCPELQRIPELPGPALAIDFLPDGSVVGVSANAQAFSWRAGRPKLETLPVAARSDAIWAIRSTGGSDAIAIGTRIVVQRDSMGTWSVLRQLPAGRASDSRFEVTPDSDLIRSERSVQVWDRLADSLPVAIVYRLNGDETLGAMHGLRDGRVVLGISNPQDPTLGGRLVVLAEPARANRSQQVSLPITVDITDLADDGYYLYVVGQGGSLKIPLDSLPFGTPSASN